jgi:competence protein ComEA
MKGIVVALSAAALASALSAAQSVDSSALPPGEDRELLVRVCGDCHGLENVTSQRRTQAEWRGVVDDMTARGAEATEEEIKALVLYLSLHVGRVNVNRASAEDLKGVLELSTEQAEAMVTFRTRQGDFHTIDDVKKVPGIPAQVIDERKDRIVF